MMASQRLEFAPRRPEFVTSASTPPHRGFHRHLQGFKTALTMRTGTHPADHFAEALDLSRWRGCQQPDEHGAQPAEPDWITQPHAEALPQFANPRTMGFEDVAPGRGYGVPDATAVEGSFHRCAQPVPVGAASFVARGGKVKLCPELHCDKFRRQIWMLKPVALYSPVPTGGPLHQAAVSAAHPHTSASSAQRRRRWFRK